VEKYYLGEMGNVKTPKLQVYSGIRIQIIMKIDRFLAELFEKKNIIKRVTFTMNPSLVALH